MRRRTSATAILTTAFSIVVRTASKLRATPTDDACSLLTQDQAGSVLAVSVGAGVLIAPTIPRTFRPWRSPQKTGFLESVTANLSFTNSKNLFSPGMGT